MAIHKGIRIHQYLDDWLVRAQIRPNLSEAYSDASENVPRPRLVDEYGKIGVGTQTSLRLCRLPVRPQIRPGLTYTGPMAKPSRENTGTVATTGLSGPVVHVLDRFANSHRETSSPTHETHTVASQKSLESTGITRKIHSITQVPAPTFTMEAGGEQCAPRSTITPNKNILCKSLQTHQKKGGALT